MLFSLQSSTDMHYRLLPFIALFLLPVFTAPDVYAQKSFKKPAIPTRAIERPAQTEVPSSTVSDINTPTPVSAPVPQQSNLAPEMKPTKKVVVVPAPPPPPGRDPVPTYPKR